MKLKYAILLTLPLLLSAGGLQAQSGTITFRNGFENTFSGGENYTGTQDTLLRSSNPQSGYNYGGDVSATFNSTAYAGLLYFDLSSFSDTVSSVENVTLRLAMRGAASDVIGTELKILVYQMNAENAGWKQGVGNSVAATPGEVAWAFKAKGSEDGENTPWASSESGFSAGDYSSEAVGSYDFVLVSGTAYIDIVLPGDMVAAWINNPSSNAGLVIRSDIAISARFYTSEHNTQSAHPGLTFDYTLGPPVPEPATYAGILGAVAIAACIAIRAKSRRG